MKYFFDTSALQHRYLDGSKSRAIRQIISDKRNECFIAELTILEIASALALHCRRNHLPLKRFNGLDQMFWRDIFEEKLRVYEPSRREFLRARQLLRHAGVEKRKKISSSDALVAACGLEVALATKDRVTFCLEDWTLFQMIREISAYRSVLKFKFIGVDKGVRQSMRTP